MRIITVTRHPFRRLSHRSSGRTMFEGLSTVNLDGVNTPLTRVPEVVNSKCIATKTTTSGRFFHSSGVRFLIQIQVYRVGYALGLMFIRPFFL